MQYPKPLERKKILEHLQAAFQQPITTSTWCLIGPRISCFGPLQKSRHSLPRFFSGQHLKKGAFNEKFQQDVSDQINVINMYEEGNGPVTEITAYEVDKALDELYTHGKSIDPDELHPTLLKNMGPNMKDLLRTLFNRVLEDKKWPFINNEVIFIPKSGKDSYLTSSSFRPITMIIFCVKKRVFSRRFRRKSRLLQWLVFFRQFNANVHFLCIKAINAHLPIFTICT